MISPKYNHVATQYFESLVLCAEALAKGNKFKAYAHLSELTAIIEAVLPDIDQLDREIPIPFSSETNDAEVLTKILASFALIHIYKDMF